MTTIDEQTTPRRSRRRGEDQEERKRRSIGEAAREFQPDKRWYHPLLGSLWLYSAASVPVWADLPPWVTLPVGAVATVGGAVIGYYVAYAIGVRRRIGQWQRRALRVV